MITTLRGWHGDPTAQGDARHWDGTIWTQSVDRDDVTVNVAIDPSQAQIPPAPGTQVSIPPPPSAAETGGSSKSSPIGIIIGLLFVFVIVIMIVVFAITDNGSSDDDIRSPGSTPSAPATEAQEKPATDAPAEEG